MKLADIELGILKYIKQEVASKATGIKKFLIYSGVALGAEKGERMLQEYLPILQNMGLVSPEGDIDIDSLYNAMKIGIKESGDFVFGGFKFNEQDVDKLFQYIRGGM